MYCYHMLAFSKIKLNELKNCMSLNEVYVNQLENMRYFKIIENLLLRKVPKVSSPFRRQKILMILRGYIIDTFLKKYGKLRWYLKGGGL